MIAISKKNIVDEVFKQIKEKIIQKEWKPGEKIPSESMLCEQFQVSRVSVRSAIQKLRDIGLITTMQGKGSYVSKYVNKNTNSFENFHLIMNLTEKEFIDMTEFRQTFEFKCIELAVERASEEDLNRIEKALNKMIASRNDYKKYTQADLEFHLAIAKASNNVAFYTLFKQTKDIFYHYLEELNRVFGETEESIQKHIKLFQFIKNRDAQSAILLFKNGMELDINKMRALKLYDN